MACSTERPTVPEPDRIVVIAETWRDSRGGDVSAGNFVDIAAEATTFEAVAAAVVESATLRGTPVPSEC